MRPEYFTQKPNYIKICLKINYNETYTIYWWFGPAYHDRIYCQRERGRLPRGTRRHHLGEGKGVRLVEFRDDFISAREIKGHGTSLHYEILGHLQHGNSRSKPIPRNYTRFFPWVNRHTPCRWGGLWTWMGLSGC